MLPGLILFGLGVIALWAAVTGENPIAAAGAALRGEADPDEPLLPIAGAGAATSSASAGAGSSSGRLLRPHPGPVTSGCGPRQPPTAGASSNHIALDIDGETGDPVRAADGGEVIKAGWSGGYGNRVEIRHTPSLVTSYSHLSRITVRTGEVVAQGDVIGHIGSTGVSTGPHLHFEVIVNGTKVCPADYLTDPGRGGAEDDSRTRLVGYGAVLPSRRLVG